MMAKNFEEDTELYDEWRDIIKREGMEPDEQDETEWCNALPSSMWMSETSHG